MGSNPTLCMMDEENIMTAETVTTYSVVDCSECDREEKFKYREKAISWMVLHYEKHHSDVLPEI